MTSRWLALRTIPAGVAHQSALAHSGEVQVVDAFTPDVVLGDLTPHHPGWDFFTIEALVTAARTDASELNIDQMLSLRVPTLDTDGALWVVGPVDVAGYRVMPPIALRWRQEWGDLQLIIEAFWSPWWQTTSRNTQPYAPPSERWTRRAFPIPNVRSITDRTLPFPDPAISPRSQSTSSETVAMNQVR